MRRARSKRFPTKLKKLSDLSLEKYQNVFLTVDGTVAKEGSPHFQERMIIYHGTCRTSDTTNNNY